MGFTPAEVGAMSLWEFAACAAGYARAHGGKGARAPGGDIDEARLRDMGVEGF